MITGAPLSIISILGIISYISYKYFKNHYKLIIETQSTAINVYQDRIKQLENSCENIIELKRKNTTLTSKEIKLMITRKSELILDLIEENNALDKYYKKHAPSVSAIYALLVSLGLEDDELNNIYKNPQNLSDLKNIGIRLNGLASKIDDGVSSSTTLILSS